LTDFSAFFKLFTADDKFGANIAHRSQNREERKECALPLENYLHEFQAMLELF
jgi:hypothetical protein